MIYFSPKQITKFLTFLVLGLIFASIVGQLIKYCLGYETFLGFVPRFNVNAESSIPTWYSSLALLFCSVMLAIITFAKKEQGDPYTKHWAGLSIIFLFMSMDEIACIHEMTYRLVRFETSGLLNNAWVIPMFIVVLIVSLVYLKFFLHLPKNIRHLLLVSGAIFIGGAMGVEMISASYKEVHGSNNLIYSIIVTFEELFEMLGIVVLIHTLLSYMNSYVKEVTLKIKD